MLWLCFTLTGKGKLVKVNDGDKDSYMPGSLERKPVKEWPSQGLDLKSNELFVTRFEIYYSEMCSSHSVKA